MKNEINILKQENKEIMKYNKEMYETIYEIKKFIEEKYSNENGEIWHEEFKKIYEIINKEKI